MRWDTNEGRHTCVLPGGIVAHAVRSTVGWEVLVPAAGVHEFVRNPALVTWISARPVIERVIRARLHGEDPHGL
ncbi:MAG: hypothetical protein H6735_00605 [Alphaproteobacteria bacterium]|nr:hypothetical protein [Alphaproteobacteria bacterium]